MSKLEEFKSRIDALNDLGYAHLKENPDIPNASLWVKENILEEADEALAETRLAALEVHDAAAKIQSDKAIAREAVIKKGRLAANASAAAMAIINGYGQDLTVEQEAHLMEDHSAALQLLQLNKPWSFKTYILGIDESSDRVITEQMKQDLLDELKSYGI